jgi:sterol desaturase/sphingolipid hydroxylase (fatty acid hydroxylase superfamily)
MIPTSTRMVDLWLTLLENHRPQAIEFWGTLLVQLGFFWFPSFIYLALETVTPLYSQRHKLQPETKQPSRAEIRDCLNVVLRNQVFSIIIHIVLLTVGHFAGGKPTYRFDANLPFYREVLGDVLASMFLREVLFYYSHRVLHLPSIYSKIHKVHHRFTAPVALAAQYAHPIEHLLSNTLPISIPPMVLRSHVVTFWVFLAVELLETTTVHSGYDFLGGIAKAHDAHHEKFRVNFGTFGFLDWLHGTDGKRKLGKLA